ncbi:hypothetical protein VTN00DRAFT_9688 [Thermoascus crustaceus]|uniref:uncharacterized protein n=1 Tax=Thermoascus crustaceus TaxID=5088 RepID=UPI0037430526
MRSSVLLSALCAAGVMSSPVQVDKRAYETEVTVVTVTSYVPPGYVVPTPVLVKEDAQPDPDGYYAVTTLYYTEAAAPSPAPEPNDPSPPPPAPTAPTFSGSSNSYQAQVLQQHNMHRSNHSAPALAWSADLEASAKKLADSCVYAHNTDIDGGGYGQNIGYGVPSEAIGKMITNLMYNDEMGYFEGLYGNPNPDMSNFEKWGHFSQIVWKGTTQVGCATTVCGTLQNIGAGPIPFTVCNYGPAGNFAGEYADNVLRPLGQPFFAVA